MHIKANGKHTTTPVMFSIIHDVYDNLTTFAVPSIPASLDVLPNMLSDSNHVRKNTFASNAITSPSPHNQLSNHTFPNVWSNHTRLRWKGSALVVTCFKVIMITPPRLLTFYFSFLILFRYI